MRGKEPDRSDRTTLDGAVPPAILPPMDEEAHCCPGCNGVLEVVRTKQRQQASAGDAGAAYAIVESWECPKRHRFERNVAGW